MRILVTGSREWDDGVTLARVLFTIAFERYGWLVFTEARASNIIVIHGACPTGADELAGQLARHHGWTEEVHPADWAKHGKAAGPIRNQEMVDSGADICPAFLVRGAANRGTKDCIGRAEAAGIPVRQIWDTEGGIGVREPRRSGPDSPPAGGLGLSGPGGKDRTTPDHPDDSRRTGALVPS